jgi:hypothetical protein
MFCLERNRFYYELYIRKKLKYKIERLCRNNYKTQTKIKCFLMILNQKKNIGSEISCKCKYKIKSVNHFQKF